MKLRNKDTGKVVNCKFIIYNEPKDDTDYFMPLPSSIIEFNELWEDTEEPLIKDKKIRKAVRAWAEAESIPSEEKVFYNGDEYSFGWYKCEIMFTKPIQDLKEREYTIAELCGDE